MANFKVVVSDPKSRKAFQKEIEQKASGFMGKSIGDKVKGDSMGLSGYELQITGGSDAQGFPMRRDVEGIARKRLLLSIGPGFHPESRGQRKRKSIRGNTISSETSQINVKVVTYGSKPLEQLLGETKKEKAEKELTEEEKKEKLQKEVESMLDKKAPEKSRSDQILEEQEKAGEGKAEAKPEGEIKAEKPEKPKEEGKAEEKTKAASEEKLEKVKEDAAEEEDKKEKPAKEEKK